MKITTILSIVPCLISTAAFADYPAVGNDVTYTITDSAETQSHSEIVTIAAIDASNNATFTQTVDGSAVQALDPETTDQLTGITTIADNCSAQVADANTKITAENGISTPYGVFNTCHFSTKDAATGITTDTWYAKVPFGVLKEVITQPMQNADGSAGTFTETMVLSASNISL